MELTSWQHGSTWFPNWFPNWLSGGVGVDKLSAGQVLRAADLVVLLVVVVVSIAVLYMAAVYQRRKERSIPGPWPWPIVGSLPVLYNELPHKALQKLSNKYGGLMYLQLGRKPCLVVSTAAAAKEVFRKHDASFASRPPMLACEVITGGTYRSLSFSPYGPFWRQLRRVANTQLFSPAVHSSHERVRKGEMHHMMGLLVDDARKGTAINLKSWLTGVTANNMTMMLTNNRYFGSITGGENEKTKRELDELMRRTFAAIGSYIVSDYVPALSFVTKWQGWLSELHAVRALGAATVSKMIQVDKHRARATERDNINDADYVPDFVDVLLKAPLNDGDLLPDSEIVTLIVCLMNAGTDTIANIVEWGMAELMANPNVREQAQAEIDTIVGQARLVEETDHARLPFLQAVVKEIYRIHPALPLGLRRESHEPCVVAGCKLPAHTELILNTYAIHRDPSVYESPDKFKPSRFLNHHPEVDPLSGYDSYQLIPFGVGRRMCPGYNLGNVMVTSLIANLLQCFHWALPAAQSLDMSEHYSFMSFRRQPLCLIAQPRSAAALLLPV